LKKEAKNFWFLAAVYPDGGAWSHMAPNERAWMEKPAFVAYYRVQEGAQHMTHPTKQPTAEGAESRPSVSPVTGMNAEEAEADIFADARRVQDELAFEELIAKIDRNLELADQRLARL
jgi:hypothetical protein